MSGVVDQEKFHEGKLKARKPHVDNLKKYVCESFQKTSLPLIRRNEQGA
jgi:hypothetical protein